ncbi:hypothetical protein MEO93_25355, partial [Dolichospermum sp. ST_sed3]|nr:hypothetical protein [Dolichospermum sp. ST_sed3]
MEQKNMTTKKILLLFALCISFFVACKKDKGEEEASVVVPDNTLAQIAIQLNLLDQAAVQYSLSQGVLNNSLESIIIMAQWLIQQPDVAEAYIIDEYIVQVHFKSGLKSSISVIPVDASGQHLIRGGGSINERTPNKNSKTIALKKFDFPNKITGGSNTIGNNKVLIFAPYIDEFYNGNYPYVPKFSQGSAGPLTVTLKGGLDADLASIDLFSDYGFIILDTHGRPNGFRILTKISKLDVPAPPGDAAFTDTSLAILFAQANNLPLNKILNGDLEIDINIYEEANNPILQRSYGLLVTDKYIRGIKHLDNAVVFANYCYSGFTFLGSTTKNMSEAFSSVGAISYYGYAFGNGKSEAVLNTFAIRMEDSLITNLVINDDSTGIAHLANNSTVQDLNTYTRTGGLTVQVGNNTQTTYPVYYPRILLPLNFNHFFDPSYGYNCGDTITDSRDGQKYPTVCIGNQVWMAKNLNWSGMGYCYNNSPINCDTYGRLYSINELTNLDTSSSNPSGIQGICPNGWHIPSLAECQELFNFLGGYPTAAYAITTTTGWPGSQNTNSSGFGFQAAG